MDAPIPMNVSVASKILAAPSIARNIWAVDVSRTRKTKNVASLDVAVSLIVFHGFYAKSFELNLWF